MKLACLLFCILASVSANSLFAQAGNLDSDFSADGMDAVQITNSGYAQANAVVFQSDGKIVVAGYAQYGWPYGMDIAIARFKNNGFLDLSFAISGVISRPQFPVPFIVNSMQIQSDDKLLIGGVSNHQYSLARLKANGSLDSTFNNSGVAYINFGVFDEAATSIALQEDGKILIAGNLGLVRVLDDGRIDSSFGFDGMVETTFVNSSYIVIQSNNKIVLATTAGSFPETDFKLERYQSNGELDTSFGNGGTALVSINKYDFLKAMCINIDGKILVSGFTFDDDSVTYYDFALAQFNSDGSLDSSFGNNGVVKTDLGKYYDLSYGMSVQSDGKIVLDGGSGDDFPDKFALARFNSNGSLDHSFGINGIVTTAFDSMEVFASAMTLAIQSDGKIVAAGISGNDIAIARYLSGLNVGIIDLSSPMSSVLIYPNPIEQNAMLKYSLKNEEEISIRLLDVQGRILKTFIVNELQEAGDHQQKIVMPEELVSGSYLLVISSTNGSSVSVKIVK